MKTVQYILVRKDLPSVVQMVNVGHAAGESIREAPIPRDTIIRILHVENQEQLIQWYWQLSEAGFYSVMVREPDAPYFDQPMAIGLEPTSLRLNKLQKLFYHLESAKI